MYLDSAKKEEIFGKFGKGTTDTVLSSRLWVCVSKRRSSAEERLNKAANPVGNAAFLCFMNYEL